MLAGGGLACFSDPPKERRSKHKETGTEKKTALGSKPIFVLAYSSFPKKPKNAMSGKKKSAE